MKALLFFAVLGFAGAAQANPADQMRDQLLGAANILAEQFNENGACGGSMEAYISEMVKYVVDAKTYHDYNNYGTPMSLPAAVETAVGHSLSVKEATSRFSPENPDLTEAVFYGPSPGAYGNMSKMEFISDSEVLLWTLDIDNEGGAKWVSQKGTYTLSHVSQGGMKITSMVVITITTGETTQEFLLQKSWEYNQWFVVPADKSDANPYLDGYVEFPSECDA